MIAELHLSSPETDVGAQLVAPGGWITGPMQNGACEILLPDDVIPSNPYPGTWFPDRANGPLYLRLNWRREGQEISLSVDTEEPLQVLPAHSASLSPNIALVNLEKPQAIELVVQGVYPQGAAIALSGKTGWDISSRDSTHDKGFTLVPDANLKPGLFEFELKLDNLPAQTIKRMSYAHTGPLVRTEPAILRLRALEVALPEAKIAYIGGGAERVNHWLEMAGMDVVSLDDKALELADFSGFDSILVGVFAFRTRPALSGCLKALHEWVREGGNLVTLYHRPWDNWGANTTPLAPLTIGKPSLRWRVTDQNAKVTYLEPGHPLLNSPNKISSEDWQGWQKERGLYFASQWNQAYSPLLSMADPGEAALFGALLSGKFGRGRHTHTSLMLHHQLEKLVPGAFRLLANLLAPA